MRKIFTHWPLNEMPRVFYARSLFPSLFGHNGVNEWKRGKSDMANHAVFRAVRGV